MMRTFKCHKVVEAEVIEGWANEPDANMVYVTGAGVPVPENFFARGYPSPGDYLVRYEEGYLSWSPKAVFEAGYTEVQS